MKKIMLLAAILICSGNSSPNPAAGDKAGDTDNSLQSPGRTKVPFIHWELMNDRAEKRIGNDPYVLVLPRTYQTDSTAAICIANLQHSADIANGSSDTNLKKFPYIKYEMLSDKAGAHRFNTWVLVSKRLIPNETAAIEAWMLRVATAHLSKGLMVDSTENVATLYKLKWRSTDLEKH